MSATAIPTLTSTLNADDSATANSIAKRGGSGELTNTVNTGSSGTVSQGYVNEQVKTITASQTLDATATVWLCNAASGAITLTLPSAAATAYPHRRISVKKIDNVNNVTITPAGVETIDGASSVVLSTQWASKTLVSNGTVWYVVD